MLKKLLIKLAGNKTAQILLEKNIRISLYLSGIGAGTGVESSGEKSVASLLKKLNEPLVIFDVGANQGQYLNLMAFELGGKDFGIHSFEPGVHTFKILEKNAPKNDKIKLNNFGLSDKKGEFELYYDEKGSGLASLTKRRLEHHNISFEKSELIKLDTVDNYAAQNGIKRISLLKLDVEGHELNVLKGASKMFENDSVDLVTFEFGGTNIDTRTYLQDFFYFFKEQKMNLYRITPSGYLFPIEKYKEQHEQFITTNFVAAKRKFL